MVEHDEDGRHDQTAKQPAPGIIAREQREHAQGKCRRQHIAQTATAHIDETDCRAAKARRAELGQHGHGRGDFSAQTKAHDGSRHGKESVVGRQRAADGTQREQRQVHIEHEASPHAVGQVARQQTPHGGGKEGDGVQKGNVRRVQSPLLAQQGTDQADRILFEHIEEHAADHQKDDAFVRARHTDLVERIFQLLHLRRTGLA